MPLSPLPNMPPVTHGKKILLAAFHIIPSVNYQVYDIRGWALELRADGRRTMWATITTAGGQCPYTVATTPARCGYTVDHLTMNLPFPRISPNRLMKGRWKRKTINGRVREKTSWFGAIVCEVGVNVIKHNRSRAVVMYSKMWAGGNSNMVYSLGGGGSWRCK